MEEEKNKQLFCFQIDENEYAFFIESVNEILNNFKITPVPQTNEEIEGVINWRGEVIPLLNLGKLLNKETSSKEEKKNVIIVQVKNEIIGFLTDKIKNIRDVGPDDILDPPHLIKGDREVLKGVIKSENDKIVHLLNEEELIDFKKDFLHSTDGQNSSIVKKVLNENEDLKEVEKKETGHLIFQLESQFYAFSVDDLEKISASNTVESQWSDENEFLQGTTRFNDEIVPLLNFKKFLGITKKSEKEKNILFLKEGSENIGLPIDEIKEIAYLNKDSFSSTQNQILLSQQKNVEKIANYKDQDKERHIFILNKESLFKNIYSDVENRISKGESDSVKENVDSNKGEEMEVLIFKSSKNTLGVFLDNIEEILVPDNITPMPKTLYFIEGIISNRGKIIPVINVNKRLKTDEGTNESKDGRIIIAKLAEGLQGILVNNIEGIVKISEDDLKEVPDIIEKLEKKYISKIIKLKDSEENIFLIDLNEFLNFEMDVEKKVS
ncbi:chemotaxis protein CheW [Bacteriovoracales bacterium]|nr:chemotaxis protein CheW [Bacteriovoracales bacterium]